jgi:hypothetical protein
MTYKRIAATTLAAFVVSQILAGIVHGFVLATDYAPYYGTLLRSSEGDPPWQMLFLPVAHLSFISALVWIYAHARLEGSPTLQGLKLGVVGWAIGQVPLWLIWYAEQPWPGGLVVKQLGLEFLSSVVLGLTVAFVGGQSRRRVADSLATVSSVRAGS